MIEETPNRTTQSVTNALATVSAVISVVGKASGQRVKRSTQVSRLVKPFQGDKGPCFVGQMALGQIQIARMV